MSTITKDMLQISSKKQTSHQEKNCNSEVLYEKEDWN